MAASAESLLSSLAGPTGAEADGGTVDTASNEPGAIAGTAGAGTEQSGAASGAAQRDGGAAVAAGSDPGSPATAGAGAPGAPAAVKPTAEEIQQNHLAALREARGELKQLKQELAALKAQPALTPQQQAALAKLEQVERDTENQEPDFLADPKGYVDTKVGAALSKLEAANKKSEETKQQVEQAEQLRQVFSATLNAEQAFVAQQPDYPQALQHIRGVRTAQLQELYPEATADQISKHIAFEERETARGLIAQNRNPAEFAYKIAKTLGYQPAKAPDPKPQPKPIDKDAVRTLGSGGGDGAPVEDAGGSMPELQAALQERFKPRKR